ncbi:Putative pumilio homolog 7, chloroplastic [Linum perenne]
MMLKVAGGSVIRRGEVVADDDGGSPLGTCFGVHHHQMLQSPHNHTTAATRNRVSSSSPSSASFSSDDSGSSPPLLLPHHDALLYKYQNLLCNEPSPDIINNGDHGKMASFDDQLNRLSHNFYEFNIRDQIRTGFGSVDGFHGGGGTRHYGDFNNGGGLGGYNHQNGVYDSMRREVMIPPSRLDDDWSSNGGYLTEQSRIDAYKRLMLTEWARRGSDDAPRRSFLMPPPSADSRKKLSSIKDTLQHQHQHHHNHNHASPISSSSFHAAPGSGGDATTCSFCQVQGHVYLMAKDQNGCRFLQRVFDEGTSKEAVMIFDEIVDHVVELSLNQFGNYVIQKMLDVCDEVQRLQIVYVLTKEAGQLVKISLNTYGTRVVQKLVETLKTRQQISLVVMALKTGLRDVVEDQNGNHVVQSCLRYLTNDDNKFIFDAATKFCVDIGTHQHGCCVMQKCIDHFKGKYLDKLVTEISKHAVLLSQDPFGNYVIQHVIEQEKPAITAKLLPQFEGHFVQLSMQKCSSNVVERLIKHSEESRPHIIHELLSVSHFDQLLQDPFANYVIQTALIFTKMQGPLHSLLVDAIRPHSRLRTSPYCKRIFTRNMLKK